MAALQHLVGGAGGHQLHVHAGLDGAFHHPEVDDDPPIGVVLAVEDEGLQGGIGVPLGGGDVLHDVLQHGGDIDAHLGGDLGGVLSGDADDILNLVLHPLGVGGGQVGVAVLGGVVELDGPGLDGDAPLLLQVHVVQQLGLHLPGGDGVALLDQPVGQGGLAVVDVSNDREVTNLGLISHRQTSSWGMNQIKAQRNGFDLERTSNGMSELCPSGESEGYGVWEDEVIPPVMM